MIIKHIDGTEINTDSLPDVKAMIHEKAEELRVLCYNTNRQCVILISEIPDQPPLSFWNVKYNNEDGGKTLKSWLAFIHMISSFVHFISSGKYLVIYNPINASTKGENNDNNEK